MLWFKKPVVIPEVRVVQREVSHLRLSEWRSAPNLTGEARKVMDHPFFKLMVDVLMNEHPGCCVMIDGDKDQRAIQQARAEGYTICLSNLRALALHAEPPKALGNPTFGTEEEEEK